MRKETAEKCKFIAGLFFFGGKKADIIRSSNESRPKLRNEIKQQDKKIKSEDERMKKKVAAIFMASIMACSMAACGSSGGSSDSGKTDSKDKSTASSTAENGSGEVEKIIVSFPPGRVLRQIRRKYRKPSTTSQEIKSALKLSFLLPISDPLIRIRHWRFPQTRKSTCLFV